MNEAETRAELIDPALAAAGWGVADDSRLRREVKITDGRLIGAGLRTKPGIADYLLVHRGRELAVIEAKREGLAAAEGVGQAKHYAGLLGLPFAFATNGHDTWRIDMTTGNEGPCPAWPAPADLFAEAWPTPNRWRDAFAAIPYETAIKPPRYYQRGAVDAVLRAIAADQTRILLTLATGTGKTAIAFHLAWKLFEARWSLSNWHDAAAPARRPRILFLADRTGLAEQALGQFKEFNRFEEAALALVNPDEIRKRGETPKNASVFFTIFQTFMTDGGKSTARFEEYPRDFFDLVIVDECHRGGANDESTWRGILEYFAPAVQLGLTATPKRRDNIDTYAYFGDPVYTYSLKQGINDGFLTPFKVRQFATTMDDYVWTPDDEVIEGAPVPGHRYREAEFNRTIHIREREAKRVAVMLAEVGACEKTLVFCATQAHAALIRDLVNEAKTVADPNWCVRVTAAEGAIGDAWLKTFQDPEALIPNMLTTSRKLSTGVDATNVRNIVLLRPVASLIEFKQIVGRGTRVYEGKDVFTILDFTRAYEHFADPEWDGEPAAPEPAPPPRASPEPAPPHDPAPPEPRERVVIRLANGKSRTIEHMASTSFWSPEGRPISPQQFVDRLLGTVPELFRDEDELRALWSVPETRAKLLAALSDKGFTAANLAELRRGIAAEASDIFDVLAFIAYARPPETRAGRVAARRTAVLEGYGAKLAAFLDFVLGQYVEHDTPELDPSKLKPLIQLRYRGDIAAGTSDLGGVLPAQAAFLAAQVRLYQQSSST